MPHFLELVIRGSSWLVACLLNVPATCECISGTDLLSNFTCCHTEIKAADPTFHLTQSQYTDTGLTSPSADPITPGAWHRGSREGGRLVCSGNPFSSPSSPIDVFQLMK